jgi:hypothetical protein
MFHPYLSLEFVSVMDHTRIYAILISKPPTELAQAQVTSEVTEKNNNFKTSGNKTEIFLH